jgi:hypothetical protein
MLVLLTIPVACAAPRVAARYSEVILRHKGELQQEGRLRRGARHARSSTILRPILANPALISTGSRSGSAAGPDGPRRVGRTDEADGPYFVVNRGSDVVVDGAVIEVDEHRLAQMDGAEDSELQMAARRDASRSSDAGTDTASAAGGGGRLLTTDARDGKPMPLPGNVQGEGRPSMAQLVRNAAADQLVAPAVPIPQPLWLEPAPARMPPPLLAMPAATDAKVLSDPVRFVPLQRTVTQSTKAGRRVTHPGSREYYPPPPKELPAAAVAAAAAPSPPAAAAGKGGRALPALSTVSLSAAAADDPWCIGA